MSHIVTGIDIETSGLDWTAGHRIIELAAYLYDSDTGVLKGKMVQRLNPQRPIDAKAQAVHGISFEELSDKPPFEAFAPTLVRILRSTNTLVAHNGAGFDKPFIDAELSRVGSPVIKLPLVDTCIDGRWATPLGKLPNLSELCFACGIGYDREKAHGASYDVQVMMACYFKARAQGFFNLPVSLAIAA